MPDKLSNGAKKYVLAGAAAVLVGLWLTVPAPRCSLVPSSDGRAGRRTAPGRPPGNGVRIPTQLSRDEIGRVLDLHNDVRSEVGLGGLVWSDELAGYAQAWAAHLGSKGCVMQHRPNSGEWRQIYGENLYMGTIGYASPEHAVAMWAGEKADYHGEPITPRRRPPVGHYTQIVWRGTSEVGCGKAECEGNLIVACNYNPPGNVVGYRPY